MPYKKSRSRCNFEMDCANFSADLKAAHIGKGALHHKDYVTAAIIFLTHAELENYIEDCFSHYALAIQSHGIKGSNLPIALQSHLFIKNANINAHFGKFIFNQSEKQLLESIGLALQGNAGDVIRDSTLVPKFTGREIYQLQKYPSTDNLKKIFYRVGVDNLFNQLSSYLKQDSKSLLESLGGLRTQLAHTATLPGVTYKDVLDRIHDTMRFVGAMDRLLYKNMTKNFNSKIWLNNMC